MFIEVPDLFGPDFGVSKIDWTFDEPSSVSLSAYTGKRAVATNPWKSVASAHVELCPVVGAANVRKLRSFIRRCKGQQGVFRLFAEVGIQNYNVGVTVALNASAGDTVLHLAGYATPLLDGEFLTVNGQLLQCVADQIGDAVTFEPKLRQDAVAGAPAQTARPYALVYMASSSNGYSITGPAVYGVTFDVTEAVLEADAVIADSLDTSGTTFDETDLSMDDG